MARLLEKYNADIRKDLQAKFNYANPNQIPKITKISINMGIADGVSDNKAVQSAADDLTKIAGQRSVVTKAKKSIAAFKLREGMPIGTKVTLRNQRMYEFMDRLINIAMPRLRDFKGFNHKSFDGKGNYTFGLKEHIIFPEIEYDKVDKVRGLDITIVTTATNAAEAQALLEAFDMPFAGQAKN